MGIADLTDLVASQLIGMADEDDATFGVYSLDTGEVFLKDPSGGYFLLSVNNIDAETASFIDADDWL